MEENKKVEELASEYKAAVEKANAETKEAIASKASKEELEALTKTHNEKLASLEKAINDLDVVAKGLVDREAKSNESGESLKKVLEAKKEEILNIKQSGKRVVFKAPANMLVSTNTSPAGSIPLEQRLSGFDIIPSRRVRIFDLVSRGSASSNVISWVSQANKDGAAGQTAEGALKNQIDFDLVRGAEFIKKTTAFIKISDEMLEDVDFIETEIRNELNRELLKAVEAQVYAGDGTGNNLNGLTTVASTLSGTSPLAGAVDEANELDVLRAANLQIKLANHDGATAVFISPVVATKLLSLKVGSTDRRYIDQLQVVGGQLSFDGIPLIESNLVAADDYLIGDFGLASVYDKGAPTIDVGLDSDDFTKNMMTFRVEWRGAVVVKTNVRSAFVKGTFAVDKAILETP